MENRQLVSGILSKLNDVKSSKALKSFRDIKGKLLLIKNHCQRKKAQDVSVALVGSRKALCQNSENP